MSEQAIRDRRNLPLDDELFLAPLFAGVSFANLFVQVIQFVEMLLDLRLEGLLFFQDPPDLLLEAGDPVPQPFHVSGGVPDLRQPRPRTARPPPVRPACRGRRRPPARHRSAAFGGKRLELCLDNPQITFEHLELALGLLDLRVQGRQFLCQ